MCFKLSFFFCFFGDTMEFLVVPWNFAYTMNLGDTHEKFGGTMDFWCRRKSLVASWNFGGAMDFG